MAPKFLRSQVRVNTGSQPPSSSPKKSPSSSPRPHFPPTQFKNTKPGLVALSAASLSAQPCPAKLTSPLPAYSPFLHPHTKRPPLGSSNSKLGSPTPTPSLIHPPVLVELLSKFAFQVTLLWLLIIPHLSPCSPQLLLQRSHYSQTLPSGISPARSSSSQPKPGWLEPNCPTALSGGYISLPPTWPQDTRIATWGLSDGGAWGQHCWLPHLQEVALQAHRG